MRIAVASIAGALLTFSSWGSAQETGRDLTRHQSAVDAFVAPVAPTCPIVFVGSSSITGWKSLHQDMAPYAVLNRGFGGSTIAEVNHFFAEVVGRYRPWAIFFYAGVNDLAEGAPPEAVLKDFRDFLALKEAALADTPVYFISLVTNPARLKLQSKNVIVNEAIEQMARDRDDLFYIDVASAFLEDGKPIPSAFGPDRLHMSSSGYTTWSKIVRSSVVQAANQARPPCDTN